MSTLSERLFARAQSVIPGGVNSPVRAWRAVGGHPLFIQRAKGCAVWDADGRSYLDFVGSWGPMILGHAHPRILDAIQRAMRDGTSYGAPTLREVELAEMLTEAIPSLEMVRLVSSGTEATMSAIRLARGATRRSRILKFDGCYHGHADSLLVRAGSGAATYGVPDSAGVPEAIASATLIAPYNNLDALRSYFEAMGDEIAAVILEPVVGNMGVIPPADGFLAGVREITEQHGALLIFDEVITGFRLTYGGYQNIVGLRPDLTCLGKIVGGGLPLAAFGGRRDLMEQLAPLGPVYQAGTLSGNPLAVAAGIETLEMLHDPSTYARLDQMGADVEAGLRAAIASSGLRACVNRMGSMWTLFLGVDSVSDPDGARRCDTNLYARWFGSMIDQGIYLPPSQFEAAFVSLAHGDAEITEITAAAHRVLELMARTEAGNGSE